MKWTAPVYVLTLEQLISMSGVGRHRWTPDRLERFREALENSSFPDCVGEVAGAVLEDERERKRAKGGTR